MLGRLLQTATAPFQGSAPRPNQTPLESIQEELHTRELLFPDPSALKAAQQFGAPVLSTRPLPTPKEAGSYDNKGGLDSITQDDIRIIIAQDTCGRWQSPQILFDSKKDDTKLSPKPDADPLKKQSLSARGKAMTSPPQTARRGHTPNTSIFSRPTPTSPSTPKSPDTRSLFGPSRLNRLPVFDSFADLESRDEKEETDALLNCMFGAAGFRLHAGTKLHVMPRKSPRSWNQGARPASSGGGPRKRTPLSRSTSLADGDDGIPAGQDKRNNSSKPSIMITRLFNVSLSDHGSACTHQRPAMSMDQKRIEEKEDNDAGLNGVKQKKVPMYAVSIIIQLPDEGGSKMRQPGQDGSFTPTASPRRDETYFSIPESRTTPVFDSILRNNAQYVLGHWTILNRNIEILEHAASHSLRHILQAVPDAPKLEAPPAKGPLKSKSSRQQTQQLVYVPPDCLQDDKSVKEEVEDAAKLVVVALRIRKVVVGQERWGAWREEARWVGRWAASKEQHAFFYHILTAFLGNHNVWLKSLHTSQYRRQMPSRRQIFHNEHVNIRYRTVVVANDKMAARRLIFLLSHFFPSSAGHAALQASSSLGQSLTDNPPSFSLGRERSLRKVINSRPRNSFNAQPGHSRSVSFSVVEQDRENLSSKERRGSETLSIRTAALAIPTRSPKFYKSSSSTLLAESDTPIAHFSALDDSPVSIQSLRPSSGGSIASSALSQNLKRVDTSATSSGGRWGSMVSAFWSNRRGSSTSDQATNTSVQNSPFKQTSFHEQPPKSPRLEEMVEEASLVQVSKNQSTSPMTQRRFSSAIEDSPPKKLLPRDTPEARISETLRMPLNINFNEDDGFLDISFSPGHSFQSSLASSFASFRLGGGSPYEQHSMMSSMASDASRHGNEWVIDAAGWLKTYHPNFTLQAVRPYDGLIEEIKQSMSAEATITPTPVEVDLRSGNWVDICVTLVADTTTFGIQKLRLCRRKKPGLQPDFSYEEKLFVEPVTDIDSILIEAVERVIAVSSGPSRSHSRASSPKTLNASQFLGGSHSASRPTSIRGRTMTSHPDGRPLAADAPHNETKRAVLGALEEVVRSVVEEVEMSGARTDKKNTRKEENSLRMGVKKWLSGIAEF
ncbi:MAG: hypothetical protein GOMPHAMPRED_007311 [Gomphillus americanus]|uniref:Folliculin-interacting protein N-terminal domain-containing protein n=1 Tax=Gomphillus americanus TaxID=1940652 RepID=A0A8H3IEV9_9LECA|nr:MAG: hypothetical protein GOMPHAMPRED_007311 [Gomphillus americanus]